ncbi:MAG TPA: DUF1549 and DUF1553 domain-containing protein, partial [Verrucomicrobiae bacterium]|nr:DUF1549 and DUF1553 domain-containing protein [Verrucomicrobiae bacterium]
MDAFFYFWRSGRIRGGCIAYGVILYLILAASARAEIDWDKEREFWAFRAPVRKCVPRVEKDSWPAQPIDFFVLARLEGRGLTPSPEAVRNALIRRVTFDLTGLPPRPEQVNAFVADSEIDSYPRLVERLMDSRAFGEHLASLWLPLARYAEDQAHQVGDDTKFFYPNAYKYRAWVVDSFNADLPYDRFLKYQIAADKIEGGSENLAALGFLGLGPKYYNRNRIEVMADEWEDRVDTVTRTTLGLTVACARCHDHKFDPITMADYYGLAGVFASTKMVNKASDGEAEKKDANADKMGSATLHMVEDGEAKDLNIFIRGNPERKGEVAERRFLRILSKCGSDRFKVGSGREELAEAIANPMNPLTARVFVNRVWGAFFGRPLVATPSNFGHSGQPPSHPELLDDLAARFMENGWSVKGLVREMVLSSTYRQSSLEAHGSTIDPENMLLWRMNRKRLSVEEWRDAVLFVTGDLSDRGGKSLELDDAKNHRRTLYGRVSRLKLNDTLMQFDYPDANVHAEKRAVTTTPIQKLFVLNSAFVLKESAAFADDLRNERKDEEKVVQAYRVLFGREPRPEEVSAGSAFL